MGRELVLGVWLALESCAGEIERVRLLLRDPQGGAETIERADVILAKVWLRIENARRALDVAGARGE